MSDSESAVYNDEQSARESGARRKLFPILWIGIPTVVCAVLWNTDVDPGLTNSLIHGSVFFGTLGLAIWIVLCSGLHRGLRWTLALLPSVAVLSYYSQLSPVETIIDGDVGVVGWRWRWNAPDKQLAIPDCDNSSALDCQSTPNDYSRFLGHGYWAEVPGIDLHTDWLVVCTRSR